LKNWIAKVEKESRSYPTGLNILGIWGSFPQKKKLKNFIHDPYLKNQGKGTDLTDYFTGTYLSTNHQQDFHKRLNSAKNAVLIFRFIPFHLYTW